MTNKKRLVAIVSILIIVVAVSVSIYAYIEHRRNSGVYVETVKQGDGWGYQIYVKGRLVVNQMVMPALPANKPFPCEKAARETAELVVQKVGKGGLPTLTRQEVTKIVADCK